MQIFGQGKSRIDISPGRNPLAPELASSLSLLKSKNAVPGQKSIIFVYFPSFVQSGTA